MNDLLEGREGERGLEANLNFFSDCGGNHPGN